MYVEVQRLLILDFGDEILSRFSQAHRVLQRRPPDVTNTYLHMPLIQPWYALRTAS